MFGWPCYAIISAQFLISSSTAVYYNISYDISSNKTRRLAVKLCKKAGLVRVQRSVFLGASLSTLIDDIRSGLLPLLDPKRDSLHIQPLDRLTYARLQLHGTMTDKAMIAKEKRIEFL